MMHILWPLKTLSQDRLSKFSHIISALQLVYHFPVEFVHFNLPRPVLLLFVVVTVKIYNSHVASHSIAASKAASRSLAKSSRVF